MTTKGDGWVAMQTAVAAVGVIVSIVVSLTAYQVKDPGRLAAIEYRCQSLEAQLARQDGQLRALRRQLDASQRSPWLRPGRIGNAADVFPNE